MPIVRTPPGRSLIAAVTSHDLIGCPTHYYQGRTTPCEAPDCAACGDGHPWRWHGWVTAIDPQTSHHFLFEFTRQAADPFIAWFAQYTTLRGCLFQAKRLGTRSNSRVQILTKPADLTKLQLPDPPNLVKVLSILWSIPTSELEEGETCKAAPRVAVDRGNNEPLPGQKDFAFTRNGQT